MKRHVRLLLGPNGCGKGTVARYLASMGTHIETMSDVLEEEKKSNPQIAETIRYYKEVLHQNVPCEIAIEAMMKKLMRVFRHKHDGLFVLDGVGRTTTQIETVPVRIWNRRPHTDIGCVFLTLSLEGTLERTARRVEEYQKIGKPIRPEDIGDKPIQRYHTYIKTQEALISRAKSVVKNVQIFDLDEFNTLQVACKILGPFLNMDEGSIFSEISSKGDVKVYS